MHRVHIERIFNVTQEERVVSGSDSFSYARAHPIGAVLELVHLFRAFGVFEMCFFSESFVHHVTNPV